jgi:DNA-directed RNA polymerase
VDLGLGLVPSEYTNDLKAGVDKVQEEAEKKAKEMADQKAKELRDQVTPKIP